MRRIRNECMYINCFIAVVSISNKKNVFILPIQFNSIRNQKFTCKRSWKCIRSTMLSYWSHSKMIPVSLQHWTRHAANSLTPMPLHRTLKIRAKVPNCWPNTVIFYWRNPAKIRKKLNSRTPWIRWWSCSNTLKTRMCFKNSTAKCWRSVWSTIHPHRMMPKPRWYPNWSKPVVTNTPSNCNECSRYVGERIRCSRTHTNDSLTKNHLFHSIQQDIGISKDLNDKFRQRVKSDSGNDLDFTIQVLSSGSWPFNQSFNFSLPTELERSVQRFSAFYADVHSGRKLVWLYNMCKGEIVTNCFKNRYTLQVIRSFHSNSI